jgi:hypothetical protein
VRDARIRGCQTRSGRIDIPVAQQAVGANDRSSSHRSGTACTRFIRQGRERSAGQPVRPNRRHGQQTRDEQTLLHRRPLIKINGLFRSNHDKPLS